MEVHCTTCGGPWNVYHLWHDHLVSAAAVVNWDHDQQGEAEFWPAGEVPEIALIFKHRSRVTAAELLDLDRVLVELGGDSRYNFLLIHYAVNLCGDALPTLSAESVHDRCVQVFSGTSFLDVRRDAALELFELYYPEEYRVWGNSACDGLSFDPDRFLDSPGFFVEEIRISDRNAGAENLAGRQLRSAHRAGAAGASLRRLRCARVAKPDNSARLRA